MVKLKFIIIFISVLFFVTNSYAVQNIGYIDMDFVIKNSNLGKSILKKIKNLDDSNIQKLKSYDKEIKKLESDFRAKENLLSEEILKKEIKILNEKINSFISKKNDMLKQFNEFKKKELNEFYKKINPILEAYMTENNLDLIIDIKTVVIGKSNTNVSENVAKSINQKFTMSN